ncbi:MAG: EAL domain-containing protein [Steroidobacteraceae bacterium]
MARIIATTSVQLSLQDLAGTYGQRIIAALPLMWARWVSMHDSRGHVHWQSGDFLGPAEREAVRVALESFVGQAAPARTNHALPQQRSAVLLRAADDSNVFRGFVMLIVDGRRLRGKGQSALDLPVPVLRAVHEWGARLAVAPRPEDDDGAALSAIEADSLLDNGPTVDNPDVDEYFARLRELQITLVAQPLVPLQTGTRIRRFEVLLREAAEKLSNSAPVELLREADARGLGSVLDRRVAGQLLVWLADRTDIWAGEPTQFSVNLSATTLSDAHFVRFVELCLEKAHIPPSAIAFEVDQTLWQTQRAQIERFGAALDTIGAGLVIDNFTLHADSAELLNVRGVRLAKIDRSVTRDLVARKSAQMAIAGIAQIARVGGVHTVAKQIDNADEQALLQALGVDFIQGFATGVPTPLETLDQRREESLIVDEGVRAAV